MNDGRSGTATGTTFETPPAEAPSLDSCFFYHSVDLPLSGAIEGQWDLRGQAGTYLGGVDLRDRRVLELGPASGFLTVSMEQAGARVTARELANYEQWDIVPYRSLDADRLREYVEDRQELGSRLRNSFWRTLHEFDSSARLTLGTVYDLPHDLGAFDVTVFGSILLHVRDPLQAVLTAAARTREAIVVTDILPGHGLPPAALEHVQPKRGAAPSAEQVAELNRVVSEPIANQSPALHFVPDPIARSPLDTWWQLTPAVVRRFLELAGCRQIDTTLHYQQYDPRFRWLDPAPESDPVHFAMFTTVGRFDDQPGGSTVDRRSP